MAKKTKTDEIPIGDDTALAKTEAPGAIAPARGMEGVLPGDLAPLRLCIDHEKGLYGLDPIGEWETVTVAALKYTAGRVLWDKDLSNTEPLCRSANGFVPSPLAEQPRAPTCAVAKDGNRSPVCPLAQWGQDEVTGKPKPPPCADTSDWLVAVIAGDGEILEPPVIAALTFSRTGMKAAKKILTALYYRSQQGAALETNRFDLRLDKRRFGEGRVYYVPVPGAFKVEVDQHITDVAATVTDYEIVPSRDEAAQ